MSNINVVKLISNPNQNGMHPLFIFIFSPLSLFSITQHK